MRRWDAPINNGVGSWDGLGLIQFWDDYIQLGRDVWNAFATEVFRKRMGLELPAIMLEMSLCEFDRSNPVVFSGRLERETKASKEYESFIGKEVVRVGIDTSKKNSNRPINFNVTRELKFSVGHALIDYDGTVCQKKDGKFKIDLNLKMHDRYDFDLWIGRLFEGDLKHFGLGVGNNLAWLDQKVGIILPYLWEVSFDEHRTWPW